MLWIRLGDGDDYHAFDDLSEAAEHLSEFGVRFIERRDVYGVTAEGFRGHNYISLFWGNADAQPTRGVSADELNEINAQLASVTT